MADHPVSLYQALVDITADYLGPASKRFVDRQIDNHIGKQPTEITRQDLTKFIDWTRVALAVLTDDAMLIEEYISRLKSLQRKPLKRTA